MEQFIRAKEGKEFLRKHAFEARNAEEQIDTARKQEILTEIYAEFVGAIKSVLPNFNTGAISVRPGESQSRAYITVDYNALHRDSLHYTRSDGSKGGGEGIDDILALFTHGYTLKHRAPYGTWTKGDGTTIEIRALAHRDPNPFLEHLVASLTARFGDECVIRLNDDYLI